MKEVKEQWAILHKNRKLYVSDIKLYSKDIKYTERFDSQIEAEEYLIDSVLTCDTKDYLTGKIFDLDEFTEDELSNSSPVNMNRDEFEIVEIVVITDIFTKSDYRRHKINNIIC